MNDFFVGYLPTPPAIAGFLRRVVIGLGTMAVVIALLLVRGQGRFAASTFEFGKLRDFEGVIAAEPYPTLLVARPGQIGQNDGVSRYLLVAPGKHGADNLATTFNGKRVRLRGQLIYRAGATMVEVEPTSVVTQQGVISPAMPLVEVGPVILTGEIVDSKCYLGVMNPGSGKIHRDCAARCLSGGIPPLFATTDGSRQYLLITDDGHAVGPDVLREYVAEPITVNGMLVQRGEEQLLMINPQELRHPASRLAARLHRQ